MTLPQSLREILELASATGRVKPCQAHEGRFTRAARLGLLIYRGDREYELTAEGLMALEAEGIET